MQSIARSLFARSFAVSDLLVLLLFLLSFFCFSPSSWMYVNHAYGTQSREFAMALWRDRSFKPVDQVDDPESKEAYINSLLRWNAGKIDASGNGITIAKSDLKFNSPENGLTDDEIRRIRFAGSATSKRRSARIA